RYGLCWRARRRSEVGIPLLIAGFRRSGGRALFAQGVHDLHIITGQNDLAQPVDELIDGQSLLRRPGVRNLEEYPEVAARHGCAPARPLSPTPRRLCCRAERAGRFCLGEAKPCVTGLRNEGPSMLMLMQRCRRRSSSASTRCFFSKSSYQSSSSSDVVMMVETRL